MADSISIHGIGQETAHIFEEGTQIINITETGNAEISIFEPHDESITVIENNNIINLHENEDKVIVIYEPGQQGARGNAGGEYYPPEGLVSGSNQVDYYIIRNAPFYHIDSLFETTASFSFLGQNSSASFENGIFIISNVDILPTPKLGALVLSGSDLWIGI